jgi:hypothetical protein
MIDKIDDHLRSVDMTDTRGFMERYATNQDRARRELQYAALAKRVCNLVEAFEPPGYRAGPRSQRGSGSALAARQPNLERHTRWD